MLHEAMTLDEEGSSTGEDEEEEEDVGAKIVRKAPTTAFLDAYQLRMDIVRTPTI